MVAGEIVGTKINEESPKVFIVINTADGRSTVAAYRVGKTDPEWQANFDGPGSALAFSASDDRSSLFHC